MILTSEQLLGIVIFCLALIHTFLVKQFQKIAKKFPNSSLGENFFHLLGEVEVVFGLWAGFYLILLTFFIGAQPTLDQIDSKNFTEPTFVFVILVICSSRPILETASQLIEFISRLIPLPSPIAFYLTSLTVGSWFGSLITEPAAMTVLAIILYERFYKKGISDQLKYSTLGLLFVNISIGGTLTPFAAPPVLIVARKWDWNLTWTWTHLGWKAMLATLLSTGWVILRSYRELKTISWERKPLKITSPLWMRAIHFLILTAVVMTAHHLSVFIGIFLFFLGVYSVTQEFQGALKLREGLLVAFFLSGIIILGDPQRIWLEPLLTQLQALPLFLGATFLTAFTDNAALTYLGSQVPSLSELSKYALVTGAVTGGGLTVIANAPNPAGYGILNPAFGDEGINPLGLTQGALIPTFIAGLCFWLL